MKASAWACAALAGLAGCLSLDRETPVLRTYAPTIDVPAERPGQGVLAVGRFEVVPRFARRELVYRQTDVLYEADPYHLFLAEPGQLLREETERWMRGAGLFAHAGDPARFGRADVRLEGVVEALYGDYRDPSSPRARLGIRFLAWSDDGRLLLDRAYDADVPLADRERATLVRGWEAGLGRVLASMSADLRRAVRGPSSPPAD